MWWFFIYSINRKRNTPEYRFYQLWFYGQSGHLARPSHSGIYTLWPQTSRVLRIFRKKYWRERKKASFSVIEEHALPECWPLANQLPSGRLWSLLVTLCWCEIDSRCQPTYENSSQLFKITSVPRADDRVTGENNEVIRTSGLSRCVIGSNYFYLLFLKIRELCKSKFLSLWVFTDLMRQKTHQINEMKLNVRS